MYKAKSSFVHGFNECISQNQYFFLKYHMSEACTSMGIRDSRILFTNQYVSSIEVSISEAQKSIFKCMHRYNYYLFTEVRYVLWKIYLYQDNSFILKPHIAPNWFLGSQVETSSRRQIAPKSAFRSAQITPR